MSKKLYEVTCVGLGYSLTKDTIYGVAYVIAEDAETAYKILRKSLDKRGIGFPKDRVLKSIKLIAEAKDFPETTYILYGTETT